MPKKLTKSESGKRGGDEKSKLFKATRKELIDKVSSQVDKEVLSLIQSHLSNNDIEKLLKIWSKK